MIHTDGIPTIANAEPRSARLENLARDLAAVQGCTLEQARERVHPPRRVHAFPLQPLADMLVSDEPGLD